MIVTRYKKKRGRLQGEVRDARGKGEVSVLFCLLIKEFVEVKVM
jgi:hypothetical protein